MNIFLWNKVIKQSKSPGHSITCCIINNSIIMKDPVVPGVKTLHDIVAIRKLILGAPKWIKWNEQINFFSCCEEEEWISSPHLLCCFQVRRDSPPFFPAYLAATGKPAVLSCSLLFMHCSREREGTGEQEANNNSYGISSSRRLYLTKHSNFSSFLPFICHPQHKGCILFFLTIKIGTKAGEQVLQRTLR